MTDTEAIRSAALHWYDRLCEGEAQLDYEGQVEQLERALGIEEP